MVDQGVKDVWYRRGESNPHYRSNWILNPARLPVPPLRPNQAKNYNDSDYFREALICYRKLL